MSTNPPLAENFAYGSLRGTKYTFARRGDTLPRHQHPTQELMHIVVPVLGSVVCREFEGDEVSAEIVVRAGQVLDGDAPMDHEIEALTDGTVIINFIKGSTKDV